jgi:hypothetical protein
MAGTYKDYVFFLISIALQNIMVLHRFYFRTLHGYNLGRELKNIGEELQICNYPHYFTF